MKVDGVICYFYVMIQFVNTGSHFFKKAVWLITAKFGD